jgi:glycosyltransferase involved in cell wall biosynthesis
VAISCVGALLVRNEAGPDRYLRRVLANVSRFCDKIVVLDDDSTDDTVAVCMAAGAHVRGRLPKTAEPKGFWEGHDEGNARAHLWRLAVEEAEGGWVYVADADHELVGIEPDAFRLLLRSEEVTAWACPLWDCWDSEDTMRVDGFWQAHNNPRPWLYRALSGPFTDRAIHSGHAPLLPWRVGLMPPGAAVKHLGYVSAEHRVAKREKYLQLV